MCFQKIDRLKIDSGLQWHSQKSYCHFIEILQAKGHFYYLNGGYPLQNTFNTIALKKYL